MKDALARLISRVHALHGLARWACGKLFVVGDIEPSVGGLYPRSGSEHAIDPPNRSTGMAYKRQLVHRAEQHGRRQIIDIFIDDVEGQRLPLSGIGVALNVGTNMRKCL